MGVGNFSSMLRYVGGGGGGGGVVKRPLKLRHRRTIAPHRNIYIYIYIYTLLLYGNPVVLLLITLSIEITRHTDNIKAPFQYPIRRFIIRSLHSEF